VSIAALPELRGPPAATAAQMAEADRVASTELGIPLAVLMENAARQIAATTRSFLGGVDARRVVAVCGAGNNGGDALGALRHLHGWGAQVEAIVAAPRDRLRPLAALQLDILARLDVPCHDASTMDDATIVHHHLQVADVLLDGLLGYSAKGVPRGEIARLILLMTAGGHAGQVVAVDLPSGLDPDTGVRLNDPRAGAVRASLTVTLALPKTGLLRAEAREWVGDLVLADIGIPAKSYEGLGIAAHRLFADGDLLRIIP
jgi:NAD(P)H-hydrate epimerase